MSAVPPLARHEAQRIAKWRAEVARKGIIAGTHTRCVLGLVLLLLCMAVPGFAQSAGGLIVQHWEQPTEFPNGPFPCVDGYKLQRYHQALTATIKSGIQLPYIKGSIDDQSGWMDVDAGPHEGDYRCVKKSENDAASVPIPNSNAPTPVIDYSKGMCPLGQVWAGTDGCVINPCGPNVACTYSETP
jgi:hypothetical protein